MFNCDNQQDFDAWLLALDFNERLEWLLIEVLSEELESELYNYNNVVWIV